LGYALEIVTTEKPLYFSIENPSAYWMLFFTEAVWFLELSLFLQWMKLKSKSINKKLWRMKNVFAKVAF
ncbi:MAG: hypothetical protein RL259_1192, partial [Bacteroidota bacterium]